MEFEPLRPISAAGLPTSGLWECTLCDKSMPEISKRAHLKGKPHAKKAAAAGNPAPEPVVNTPSEQKKDKWKCPTCKCTMKAKYKKCHLGSNPHNTKLIDTGGIPEFWNCNICNHTMKIQKQAHHLAGKFHKQRVKAQPLPKPKSKTTSQNTAPPTMVTAEPQRRAQAEKIDKSPPHPNGKYLIKISEVKDVYDDVDDIPIDIWEGAIVKITRGKNTLVTAMEVQAARDVYDTLEMSGGENGGGYGDEGGDEGGDEYGNEDADEYGNKDDGQWGTVEGTTTNWNTPVDTNADWD